MLLIKSFNCCPTDSEKIINIIIPLKSKENSGNDDNNTLLLSSPISMAISISIEIGGVFSTKLRK